jgi:serine/threonine-protein kinase
MMSENKSMNNSNESDETKHLGDTEEIAQRWEQITKIFEAASALTGKEREKFLKKSCGDDAEMRNEVEKLLKSFEDSESFMQNPAVAEAVSMFEEKKTLIGKNTTGEVEKGSFVAGTVLASRYRIIGMLGKGGMGEVYKAEDIKLSQTVALKFLPDSFQKDSAALERFHAEVRNARQVSHVNVCRVFDIGEIDGKHFLSMEFIDGDDLSQLLRRVGRLSSERAIEIARQLCVGLSAIHNAGILHRDFKPANVIIDSKGKARITDFGIAGVEAEIAKDNLRVGTPAYMSPEQITGKDVSQKSDIYALGLVLYEIFTGKQAFSADSIPELIKKQTSETPTNPSEFVKGIDPLVESVISQCIAKNPNDRPQSALHVAMALPGGNPLQIALDAGQTPTPEMIAASPKKGALKPVVALLCLLGVIVSLISMVYINGRYKTFNLTPLQKSPEALADRAETMIKSFGYTEKPADKRHNFQSNGDFLRYAKENNWKDTADRLRTGQPYEIYFLYRQSPRLFTNYVRNEGGIAESNPPFEVPGMVNVSLDTTGRLIEFRAIPPENTANVTEISKTDWTKLFTEAGLDQTKFEKVASEWTPPMFSDERIAWKGTLADWTDIPIRVEAAAFQGKPVYFRIKPPWQKPQVAYSAPSWSLVDLIGLAIFLGAVVSSILLVWRNIKLGRADLRGTGKIALVFFVFNLIFQLTTSSLHYADIGWELWVIIDAMEASLFIGILSGLFYCAVEPFVRRWWSEMFISWSRLLAGDFRDPMVGRDILVGGLLGLVANLLFDKLSLLLPKSRSAFRLQMRVTMEFLML